MKYIKPYTENSLFKKKKDIKIDDINIDNYIDDLDDITLEMRDISFGLKHRRLLSTHNLVYYGFKLNSKDIKYKEIITMKNEMMDRASDLGVKTKVYFKKLEPDLSQSFQISSGYYMLFIFYINNLPIGLATMLPF